MQTTREVIQAADDIGLFVRACVSDMGSGNRDMWKQIGICSNRLTINHFIQHPARAQDKLCFLADPPHLLKSVRNCLLTQNIILSNSIVIQNQLPSNIVSFDHVRTLIKLQSCNDLKIAPHLKEVHVNPGQYQKMKGNLAAQVLSHTTATALKFCVDR